MQQHMKVVCQNKDVTFMLTDQKPEELKRRMLPKPNNHWATWGLMSEVTMKVGAHGWGQVDKTMGKYHLRWRKAVAEAISHAKGSGWKGQNRQKLDSGLLCSCCTQSRKKKFSTHAATQNSFSTCTMILFTSRQNGRITALFVFLCFCFWNRSLTNGRALNDKLSALSNNYTATGSDHRSASSAVGLPANRWQAVKTVSCLCVFFFLSPPWPTSVVPTSSTSFICQWWRRCWARPFASRRVPRSRLDRTAFRQLPARLTNDSHTGAGFQQAALRLASELQPVTRKRHVQHLVWDAAILCRWPVSCSRFQSFNCWMTIFFCLFSRYKYFARLEVTLSSMLQLLLCNSHVWNGIFWDFKCFPKCVGFLCTFIS